MGTEAYEEWFNRGALRGASRDSTSTLTCDREHIHGHFENPRILSNPEKELPGEIRGEGSPARLFSVFCGASHFCRPVQTDRSHQPPRGQRKFPGDAHRASAVNQTLPVGLSLREKATR